MMTSALKQIALEKLAAPASKDALLDLIRWLDLECAGAAPESLPQQILTRAIVAAGFALAQKRNFPATAPAMRTIDAAAQYCLAPTEHYFDCYFEAATASYPFGAGDGCYAIDELGYASCEPGSGCRSGAGSLYQMALDLSVDAVWQALTLELIPWLQGGVDPVQLRAAAG
jgi:hypothetical protein